MSTKGGKSPALLSPPRGNGKYSRAERACRKALQNIFCHFVHHSKKGTACWPRPLSSICERAFFASPSVRHCVAISFLRGRKIAERAIPDALALTELKAEPQVFCQNFLMS